MVNTLVTDAELVWVLESFGRAGKSAVAETVPLSPTSVYVRLRSLERRGCVTRSASRGPVEATWSVTERGRALVADAGLPPVAETDLVGHFAGRRATIDSREVLAAVAELGGAADPAGWVRSSEVCAAVPYSTGAIRGRLLKLREAGLVKRDASGRTHRWRVTERGRARLADAAAPDRPETDGRDPGSLGSDSRGPDSWDPDARGADDPGSRRPGASGRDGGGTAA